MDDIKRFWGHYERPTDQFGGRWSGVAWSWHNCWTIVENQLLEIGRVRLGSVLGKHRGDEVRCLGS